MHPLIEKHLNKVIVFSPVILFALIVFGAFYILSLGGDNRETAEDISPRRDIALSQFENLNPQAKAFVVYDSNQQKIIYSKNETAQLPLASITKVMSALVALDLAGKDTIIDVKPNNEFNSPYDRNILPSGKWKLGDLLRLTLVASSNTGINTISHALSDLQLISGGLPAEEGERKFLVLMNQRASKLGLQQTFFLNESGLDVNESLAGAYGSARDVALLFDHALKKDPDIFGATKYNSIIISSTDGYSNSAANTNRKVSEIRGLVASKTGFTDLAQGNLVIAFDINEKTRVIIAVLGSTQEGRFTDTEILAKAALAYYSLI